jgi:hypothetical protein
MILFAWLAILAAPSLWGRRPARPPAPRAEPTKQLFISNLSWNTDSDTLADHFAQVGCTAAAGHRCRRWAGAGAASPPHKTACSPDTHATGPGHPSPPAAHVLAVVERSV